MGKEKKQKVELTEMLVAKACPSSIYWGIITRSQAENGNSIVFSRILKENDDLLCAQASNQKELANNLNSIARMICIERLHEYRVVTIEIFGTDLFLN